MLDFLMISTRSTKRGVIEIYPKLIIPTKKKSSDLMIRGGDFYAVWIEELGLWSTDEGDALTLIDMELDKFAEENRQKFSADSKVKVLHMWDAESGMIDSWHKYCQKQLRDSFHTLDDKIIFSNMETKKRDYASKKLPYPLEPCETPGYDKLMSVLYSDEERTKIEWAIGSIVCGDSKKIQKFIVLYGAAGTGKSTVLNIIQQLFEGYYSVFDARALGSSSNSFALEAFKSNPLVAIQHDGDLSHIEDNTRLNSLVSHEIMTVNEKFKSTYANRFKSFLFMGTNKPVKITDAKSGLIRRLIDVSPTGDKLSAKEYREAVKQISFELGGIACHCRDVYLEDPGRYDDYIPTTMLGASNDFYNYVLDSYFVFKKEDGTTLTQAWEMYKTYCDQAKVPYPFSQRIFKEELKNYFAEFKERFSLSDGTRVRSYYSGFRADRFENSSEEKPKKSKKSNKIVFEVRESVFDRECADCPAQYASSKETPSKKWENVKMTLNDLDTSKLHYVKVPENHIVIDFDIPDENGEKSFEKNLEEASKWPPTYAELSKSEKGIHLHYIYSGDPTKLSRVYDDHIEIKVFTGNSSLRRKLSKCNDLPIATISSGLPMKGEKVVNFEIVKSENSLRALIKRNLNKEIHPGTKPSIDFINKILEDAYASGLHYDVSDMRQAILVFAMNSTHQADYCIKLVNKMKFQSEDIVEAVSNDDQPLVFYDVEVFPNLFLVNWKLQGDWKMIGGKWVRQNEDSETEWEIEGGKWELSKNNSTVIRMINPSPSEIEGLMKYRLVGFNCRRYDNHMLYARLMGYTNEQLFNLSQNIINSDKKNSFFFGSAYNISYTDIYDFCSKKQSLKKWEIELGIHHQELGLQWDQPVPEELWQKVAEYCDNDVLATEAVFNARQADWTARQILAEVAGGCVNDTTNMLTTKIIFGDNKTPQDQFNYRNMGDLNMSHKCFARIPISDKTSYFGIPAKDDDCYWKVDMKYTVFDKKGRPLFPDYVYDHGKSIYRGEEVGEGGYVYAEPGIYTNVALLDIASMHPSSIVAEELFGPEYTQRFEEILQARIAIKHGDYDKARKMLGGKLSKYLTDESAAKDLANALKIAINSVYGLTAATFDNPFHDKRNKDNIVAKRGALFMVNLKHEVQNRGFTVAHIKTDSIKIPNATPEIIQFVMDYGKAYGYNFEHEATYDRMCLVNDAVYIAKYQNGEWTATGTQFQIPYVFKKLFSHEEILFDDKAETKSVSQGVIYLDMNEGYPDVSDKEKELAKLESKYKKGELSDTTFEKQAPDLVDEIAKGHNYIFVGKVGQFCPIKPGCGGGILYRMKDNKYYAITGTKGYRWLESEVVKTLKKEGDIDESYYIALVDDAIDTINKYGDFERFSSDEPYFIEDDFMNIPEDAVDDEIPFK